MKTLTSFLTPFLLAVALCVAASASADAPTDAKWNMFDRRIGMFVHWGVHSVAGRHCQILWRDRMTRAEYEKLAERFTAEKFDADKFVDVAESAGADYIVFTAKHHDGFCMWDTATTDYKVTNTPVQRDVLAELAAACRRRGMKLGLYYSNPDWHHPNAHNPQSTHQIPLQPGDRPDMEKYAAYVKAQVTELLTKYGEIVCFFWDIPTQIDRPEMDALVRRLQPGIMINDRGWGNKATCDYSTPERDWCSTPSGKHVEACDSVGAVAWGYRSNEDYRTLGYLTRRIDKFLAGGANFLLNVGPKPDGTIPEEAVKLMAGVGDWCRRVGDAFKDVNTAPFKFCGDARMVATRRGDAVFIHFPDGLNATGVYLDPIATLPERATLLNTGDLLKVELDANPNRGPASHKKTLHVWGIPADAVANECAIIRLDFSPDLKAHREAYAKFWDECRKGAFVVGQASSMENVRPRADFKWRKADEVNVRLARGERESVQILVARAEHDLKDVTVDIVMEGLLFDATNVTASVVGYVQTTNTPNYKVRTGDGFEFPTPGWWPDPILDFQKSCDVSGDDVQSFWVRVMCPRGQRAGTYKGALVVSAKGEASVRIPFSVRVNDFEIGRGSPLPLAISCNVPGCNEAAMGGRKDVVKRLRNDPESYHNAHRTREREYTGFFADYMITRSTMYATEAPGGEPFWDDLVRLKERSELGMFCLFYFRALPNQPDGEAVWRGRFMDVMRRRYDKAKELGILDKAYFYGCDEFNPPTFTNIQAAAKILHKEFPGVPVMTTARDVLLGTGDSILKDIDIHCPAVCFWENRPVAEAQKAGKRVWWYFCNVPTVPYANTMIEGPPAEIRSLMGAQTQKFKPDGFLYYATMKWNSESPITQGPFTEWTPATGDGQWTCCGGPDLLPLATIRLENFRDGLEDLWYVRELERRFAVHKNKNDKWANAAKAALAVPDEVARSVKDFSTDSDVIYRWRDGIADLIEAER